MIPVDSQLSIVARQTDHLFDLVALHAASSYPGAQLYVSYVRVDQTTSHLIAHKRRWNVLKSISLAEDLPLQQRSPSLERTRLAGVPYKDLLSSLFTK